MNVPPPPPPPPGWAPPPPPPGWAPPPLPKKVWPKKAKAVGVDMKKLVAVLERTHPQFDWDTREEDW